MKQAKSGIIYNGPSMIDGKPIVVIAIADSNNSKTGGMLQTHILRADIDPRAANQTGADSSICGQCPHAGIARDDNVTLVEFKTNKHGKHYASVPLAKERTCYVSLAQGTLGVWKAFKRGRYDHVSAADIGSGRVVRLGTYGDPMVVPESVWHDLLSNSTGRTGYTHQHNAIPDLVMTSADSIAQARSAWDRGERTFRVVSDASEITDAEILCPASRESGYKTTCERCKLCSGNTIKTKSVAIPVHGTGKKNFNSNNIIARG